MNINRSSFMTSHEQYQALRSYVHRLLHTKVFTKARARYEIRQISEKAVTEKQRVQQMSNCLKSIFRKDFQINWVFDKSDLPVIIDVGKATANINKSSPFYSKLSKSERNRLENLLVYVYASYVYSKGDSDKMLKQLLSALQEWKHE